jgi:hypothetical protein
MAADLPIKSFWSAASRRTLLTDSARYLTPDDAAQAGYDAVASIPETPCTSALYAQRLTPPHPVIAALGLTPTTAPLAGHLLSKGLGISRQQCGDTLPGISGRLRLRSIIFSPTKNHSSHFEK